MIRLKIALTVLALAGIVYFCLAGNRASLKFVDNQSLDDTVANQNAEDGSLRVRRLQALHFFRNVFQPLNSNTSDRNLLKKLNWLNSTCVKFGPSKTICGNSSVHEVIIEILEKPDVATHCRVYVGFSSCDHSKSAYEFLINPKAELLYLGLEHESGLLENYCKDRFWMSYLHVDSAIDLDLNSIKKLR